MGLWSRTVWNRNQTTASSAQPLNLNPLPKVSGIRLLGAFFIVGLLSLVIAMIFDSRVQAPVNKNVASQSSSPVSSGQSSTSSSSSTPLTVDPTDGSGGTSTSVNTSTTNGATSTQVSVDGQQIAVPDNGSSHQDISTPNGQTSIDVSNNKSTQGSSTNSSFTSTNFNVYSSTSTSGGH